MSYEFKSLLGSGEFGHVWLAHKDDTPFAYKFIPDIDHTREKGMEVVQSVDIMSRLSHPSLISIRDLLTSDTCKGEELTGVIKGKISAAFAALLEMIASARSADEGRPDFASASADPGWLEIVEDLQSKIRKNLRLLKCRDDCTLEQVTYSQLTEVRNILAEPEQPDKTLALPLIQQAQDMIASTPCRMTGIGIVMDVCPMVLVDIITQPELTYKNRVQIRTISSLQFGSCIVRTTYTWTSRIRIS